MNFKLQFLRLLPFRLDSIFLFVPTTVFFMNLFLSKKNRNENSRARWREKGDEMLEWNDTSLMPFFTKNTNSSLLHFLACMTTHLIMLFGFSLGGEARRIFFWNFLFCHLTFSVFLYLIFFLSIHTSIRFDAQREKAKKSSELTQKATNVSQWIFKWGNVELFPLFRLLSCNISTPFTINQVEFAIICFCCSSVVLL